ncbi:MAG: UvrD-helicase domain-containing protein [Clostridiales bacterium]|nr:UvrD-helicase domain-containing protein [Clostridiales bacterium]
MAFTENQRRAVTTSGNIIVSAGAGSGKTTVMIARIIDKLKNHDAALDEMLIVTFTRASAADMRAKLTEKLYELKSGDGGKIAEAALDALPTSNIGTLHSYCQRLIRMFFYTADLDPSAAVCEESEAVSIKQRAVAEAVESAWNKSDTYFMAMYDMLCTRRSDEQVKSVVYKILDFALSMPDPIGYLTDSRTDSEYFEDLDVIVKSRRDKLLNDIAALKNDLESAGMAKHVIGADDMAAYINGIADDIISTSHTKRHDYTDELNEQYKVLKTACKKFREFKAETDVAKHVDSAPYSYALRMVALDALGRYGEKKKSLGKIDYSDLEHGAYRVLCDEDCLSEITKNIKYVFIDEFQDVNPLQSAIADKLRVAGAEMFVVGDIKQSIYGFRRCSPEHFKRAIANPDYTHIPLTDNFRSSEAVINFVNTVFDGVMTKEFGGVDYSDKAQRLVWGNKNISDGSAEFYAVDDAQPAHNDSVVAPPEKKRGGGYSVVNGAACLQRNAEAELVADCIVDYIKNSPAPQMSGIAVLTRSVKTPFVAALTDELNRRAVKYSVGKNSGAKLYPEVVALMDIVRCADNRLDDVALYTAMRSGLGGFSDAELAEVATVGDGICRKNGDEPLGARSSYAFWQKVDSYRGELRAKVESFIAVREKISDYALNHDCADVLGYITSEIDYFQHVYETDGSAAAVDALIRLAAERAQDVHAFLTYYDGNACELGESSGGDAVTITTIHSSKGLEYDFVIVADAGKSFNETDRYARVLASENGVFVKVPDEDTRTLLKSVPWTVENLLYPDRMRAEELRLLYVALTRAKRRLVVCGNSKAYKKAPPQSSTCQMMFFGNITPSIADVPRLPIGDDTPYCPYNNDIAAAVAARHKQVKDYNALRLKNALPVKTCVTAVAHSEWEERADYTSTAPVLTIDDRDRTKDGEDVMKRGTAYHRAMEKVDFISPDVESLRRECQDFDLVDESVILTAASAMKELTKDCIFVARERYFIANLPARLVYGVESSAANGGSVLVQGVIDLLIVHGDNTVTIVDYKTGSPSSLKNPSYRKQLELYSAAVERCTPFKVKNALLYSFASGELIKP